MLNPGFGHYPAEYLSPVIAFSQLLQMSQLAIVRQECSTCTRLKLKNMCHCVPLFNNFCRTFFNVRPSS